MIKDYYRFANFIIFFIISIVLLLYIFCSSNTFFYVTVRNDFYNWPRLLYAFTFTLLGYSFAIYDSSKKHEPEKKPYLVFVTYFTRYLVAVSALSTIIFSIFNAINATSNYLYYFITPAISIGVGYTIDFAVSIHDILYRYLGKK